MWPGKGVVSILKRWRDWISPYLEVQLDYGNLSRLHDSIDGLGACSVVDTIAGASLYQAVTVAELVKLLLLDKVECLALYLSVKGFTCSMPNHGCKHALALFHQLVDDSRLANTSGTRDDDGVSVAGHVLFASCGLNVVISFGELLKHDIDVLRIVNLVERSQFRAGSDAQGPPALARLAGDGGSLCLWVVRHLDLKVVVGNLALEAVQVWDLESLLCFESIHGCLLVLLAEKVKRHGAHGNCS